MSTDPTDRSVVQTASPSPTPSPSASLPAAVLWDFDGTLADTEPLWIDAEFELIGSLGASWSMQQAHLLVGNALLESAALILAEIGRPDLEPAWVVDQLLQRVVAKLRSEPIPWRPGAVELLAALRERGIPCALVSASYRILLDAVIERLPGDSFTASVAGDEVTEGKPHPESYLRACALLGVRATDCVVLEDSVPGAASGNAAGATVVAIEHLVPVPAAPRRLRISSLTEMDPDRLAAVLESGRDSADAAG